MTEEKTSIEAMFPIGRPAPTTAYKTCRRCKGTGWWQLGRKCFGCGGVGHVEKVTRATKLRDARAHLAERLAMVADNRARIAQKLAAGRPRWSYMHLDRDIERDLKTIADIEAEIAVLEGGAP
ncbi:MAG TPA: hypothetical protein VLE97_09715 [Gaiellaceae bacterium]|nr:hypothetical protein [Gaiellaceae bacterium]